MVRIPSGADISSIMISLAGIMIGAYVCLAESFLAADKFAGRGQKMYPFHKMAQNTRLARLSWIAYQECPDINQKWQEWQDRKKGKWGR